MTASADKENATKTRVVTGQGLVAVRRVMLAMNGTRKQAEEFQPGTGV